MDLINNTMQVRQIFNSQSIGAGESVLSDAVPLDQISGFFSLQFEITGSGTLKLEYLVSLDGETFITPSEASDIATGQTATSGPGSDGKDIISFEPVLAPWIKIKATETGTSDSATLTAYLAVQ